MYLRVSSILLSVLFLLSACESKNNTEILKVEPPELVGSIPDNGAVNIPSGDISIVLTYNKNVFAPSAKQSKITINDAVISKISTQLREVTIKVTGLEKEKTYTLFIPEGVIVGPTEVEAPEVTVRFTTVSEAKIASALSVKNPSPQAINLYNFLKENYGKKIISATMANVDWNISEAELVHNATGKYPAMAVFDYIHLYASPSGWIDYLNTQIVENWWSNNGLVGACWHWNVPTAENAINSYTYDPANTTFRAKNTTVEGTWENNIVKADLAKIAGYLKLLKDKNIPVIWRPLHEGAGNIYAYANGKAWFWWGYDGAEAYKKLWRYMFDYFQEQGLNNLIWVWTTQTKDADFYPGDNYVDIIGRDLYDQTNVNNNLGQFQLISNEYSNKIIALSECGRVAKISAQWNSGACWSFFMPWYQYNASSLDNHEHADTAWWTDAVNAGNVITRDEMPDLK